jgi:hypothetical protein
MFDGTNCLVQYHSVDKQLPVVLAFYASSTCQWGIFSCSSYGAIIFHNVRRALFNFYSSSSAKYISDVFRIKFDKIILKQ